MPVTRPDVLSYIDNLPLLLVSISALFILISTIRHLLASKQPSKPLSTDTLISPTGDSDMSKLEADVLLSSVASNLLEKPAKLSSGEDVRLIDEFRRDVPRGVQRWKRVRWWVRLIGGVAWYTVELARGVNEGSWKGIVFPVSHPSFNDGDHGPALT